MRKKYPLFCVIVFSLFLPAISNAYFTTDQNAVQLTDNAAMFTITYAFGLKDEDLYMPVFGTRDLAHNANSGAIGYEFLEDSEEHIDIGEAAGIALSNAEIRDGFYFVPAGEAGVFTFVGFFVIPEDHPELDTAMHITELPFYVGDGKTHRKLNVSELQYYISPEVDLNRGVEEKKVVIGNKHELRTDPLYISN